MSGPRGQHLYRRGAMYAVRFRVPKDLVGRLGAEFARSLGTPDPVLARRLAPRVAAWFRATLEEMRAMQTPTRAALNAGADRFLASLLHELHQPRRYHPIYRDEDIARDAELSRERLDELEGQLVDGRYDGLVRTAARRIVATAQLDVSKLSAPERAYVLQLAARASHRQMEAALRHLEAPATEYVPKPLYEGPACASRTVTVPAPEDHAAGGIADAGETLTGLVDLYLDHKRQQAVTPSTIIETRRPLSWMLEVFDGGGSPMTISADQLRKLRTSFQQMDRHKQGQASGFLERQTEKMQDWIKPQASSKYWRTVQGFFAWLLEEGYIATDHSAGLRIARRANVGVDSPDPFTDEEVARLLKTPLFSGRKHKASYLQPGVFLIGARIGGR